jgi:hypothetical protein
MVSLENQIGIFLLNVGHAVVQCLKRGREFSDAIRMGIGDLAIGLEIVDSAHTVGVTGPRLPERVHRARIVAHDLRNLLPKFFLRRGDLKPRMKSTDARIDLVMGRNGHHACTWLSLSGRGSARRIGERRHREKNAIASAGAVRGWDGGLTSLMFGLQRSSIDSRRDDRQCGEFDRTDHLYAESRVASVRCRTLARWNRTTELREPSVIQLEDWCWRATESRIGALQAYSRKLRCCA